jgi:molecular chaperone HscB
MKKQIVPPDLLEEVFELNMQLEELRMNKKIGEDDPVLLEEVKQKQSDLESKQEALSAELEQIWKEWDQAQEAASEAAIGCVNAKMLDLLNRRNYIRNLVRDVNELLEA